MISTRSHSGFAAASLGARSWRLFLAMLLILGQVLLLNHVVVHQLEEAIAPDNDHCSFCAIGDHAAPALVPPAVLPTLTYTLVLYLALGSAFVAGFPLPLVRLRGPPFSID